VSGADFSLLGAGKLLKQLSDIATAPARASRTACMKGAMVIEGDAKRRCPVDTGFLRNSIQSAPEGLSGAQVGPHAEYAAYVEYGTVNMTAQPYMRPALEAKRAEVQRVVRDVLRNEMRKR